MDSQLSRGYLGEVEHKQLRPGFELGSLIPFPVMLSSYFYKTFTYNYHQTFT